MALVQDDGDQRAFAVVFDRHADAAFSLAYRMCGRRTVAEDVVQDAFLSLWRSASRFDPARGSVRTWVLRAAHNRAIDAFRRSAAKQAHDVADEGLTERLQARERTDEEVERREDVRQVRAALDGIPSDQRRVIELAYFGGFTHTQIAELLDLPAGTVKGRMRLGMTKMRIALDERVGVSA
jgi:RNA polymerase sigma-70 factor, ECF subfamily